MNKKLMKVYVVTTIVFVALIAADCLSGIVGHSCVFYRLARKLPLAFILAMLVSMAQFILGRKTKYVFAPFSVVILFLIGVQWFARLKFKMNLGGSWIGIVLASSPQEVKMFLQTEFSGATFGAVFLFLVLGVVLFRFLWRLPYVEMNMRRAAVSGGGGLSFCLVPLHTSACLIRQHR